MSDSRFDSNPIHINSLAGPAGYRPRRRYCSRKDVGYTTHVVPCLARRPAGVDDATRAEPR
jgi:hypothetical protein